MTSEVWAEIEGFSGYFVSNFGKVVGSSGMILKPFTPHNRYPQVTLCSGNSRVLKTVHRLVAEAFLERSDESLQVNHKDGNKSNNHVSNLEWCSALKNTQHAHENGLTFTPKGVESKSYKGFIEVYNKDGVLIDKLYGRLDMLEKGYTPQNVYACVNGKLKTHKRCTFRRVN